MMWRLQMPFAPDSGLNAIGFSTWGCRRRRRRRLFHLNIAVDSLVQYDN